MFGRTPLTPKERGIKATFPNFEGVPFHRVLGDNSNIMVLGFSKFSMYETNERGEMSEIGGTHLHL